MGTKTGIEWTDSTWSPVRGCTIKSSGCTNCYAMRIGARFSGKGQAYEGLAYNSPTGPRWTGKIRFIEERLNDPLRWKKPRKIFVCSTSDLFHENVPDEWIDKIFAVMVRAHRHQFQLLTKRPERMLAYFNSRPIERIVALLYNSRYEQRTNNTINSESGGIKNRPTRTHLENKKASRTRCSCGGRISKRKQGKHLSNGEGGVQNPRRLSSNLYDNKGNKDSHRGAPFNMDIHKREDSERIDNQSQERNQRRQSSEKYGINDIQRESPSRIKSFESKKVDAQGITTPKDEHHRKRRSKNETSKVEWNDGQGYCEKLENDLEGCICNMSKADLEAHINWPLPNVWLGVSAEDQKTADERIPLLLDTPAAVRFVSAEPLLGPIDFKQIGIKEPFERHDGQWTIYWDALTGSRATSPYSGTEGNPKLDWVIVGGESGPGARPMDPNWARDIRDQCQAAGTKLLFKQWGEYAPRCADINEPCDSYGEGIVMRKVGKKAAGRELDGRTWDEFPKAPAIV